MKKQKQHRQNFAEKANRMVLLDRCLEACEITGKKPFEYHTAEESCALYVFEPSSRFMADRSFWYDYCSSKYPTV